MTAGLALHQPFAVRARVRLGVGIMVRVKGVWVRSLRSFLVALLSFSLSGGLKQKNVPPKHRKKHPKRTPTLSSSSFFQPGKNDPDEAQETGYCDKERYMFEVLLETSCLTCETTHSSKGKKQRAWL